MTEEKTNLKAVADKNIPRHVGSLIKAYSEDALYVNQPRLTDLIPLSRWAYMAMFLVGVISILPGLPAACIASASRSSALYFRFAMFVISPGWNDYTRPR